MLSSVHMYKANDQKSGVPDPDEISLAEESMNGRVVPTYCFPGLYISSTLLFGFLSGQYV